MMVHPPSPLTLTRRGMTVGAFRETPLRFDLGQPRGLPLRCVVSVAVEDGFLVFSGESDAALA